MWTALIEMTFDQYPTHSHKRSGLHQHSVREIPVSTEITTESASHEMKSMLYAEYYKLMCTQTILKSHFKGLYFSFLDKKVS